MMRHEPLTVDDFMPSLEPGFWDRTPPTLDEWAAAIAQIHQEEAEAAARVPKLFDQPVPVNLKPSQAFVFVEPYEIEIPVLRRRFEFTPAVVEPPAPPDVRLYEYKPYPKWKYHPSGDSRLVQSKAGELALGPGWSDTPGDWFAEHAPKQDLNDRTDVDAYIAAKRKDR